jgi:hypothetical protein
VNYRNPPKISVEQMPGIDWVVVGGETGPGARPMHPAWVRSVRDQCQQAGVPITNYGLTIAYSLGIFERALTPFPAAREIFKTRKLAL